MKALPGEHHRRWRLPTAVMLAFVCAVAAAAGALAQGDPPQPDFYWPYGRVQLDGANLEPPQQPVIALVKGRACGEATTAIAAAGAGVPAEDVGKTVYVIDVLHDGTNAGQRPGCGTPAAPIVFYFPEARRFALQQPGFVVGGQRVDLDLGPELSFRLVAPFISGDGVNE